MDMSPAALPPKQPRMTAEDRAHPLFRKYRLHRASCIAQLIEAPSFRDWLYQREQYLSTYAAKEHERYPEFLKWMRANKGGLRPCPAGVFPANFLFWLDGGRW